MSNSSGKIEFWLTGWIMWHSYWFHFRSNSQVKHPVVHEWKSNYLKQFISKLLYCSWNMVAFRKIFYRGSFSYIYHRTMYSGIVKSCGRGQTWSGRMKNKEDGEQESPREAAGAGSAQHVSPLLAPLLKWWYSQACQAGLSHVSEQGLTFLCVFLQLHDELEKGERESMELQEFANAILQQIADHCPDILEQVVNALEESSWPQPPQHTSGQAQSVHRAKGVESNVKDRAWNRNFWCTFDKENKGKKNPSENYTLSRFFQSMINQLFLYSSSHCLSTLESNSPLTLLVVTYGYS